jgi:hypothetical protein
MRKLWIIGTATGKHGDITHYLTKGNGEDFISFERAVDANMWILEQDDCSDLNLVAVAKTDKEIAELQQEWQDEIDRCYAEMKANTAATLSSTGKQGYNSQGLRWVNEEVGYVDEDEEYY